MIFKGRNVQEESLDWFSSYLLIACTQPYTMNILYFLTTHDHTFDFVV